MTSLRYSNDKTDIKDFIRSFKKAIPYPMIALAVLLTYFVVPVVSYVTSKEFKTTGEPKNIISYFGETTFVNMQYIQFGMVCCGMLTAIVLFRFMFSKKSVNVYFSMGITRTRLFLNRILAGVISLLIGVLVPLTITLIINISKFGSSQHVYNVFFYLALSMFTCGLSGLAIGAFSSTVSGSIIEAVITGTSISFIPTILYSAGVDAQYFLLKGYVRQANYMRNSRLLCPFTFISDLNAKRFANTTEMHGDSPVSSFADMLEGKSVPKDMKVDFDILAPVILWLVISIVLIGLGFLLMNRRKAENANSFGKFFVSAAINGTTVFSILLYIAESVGEEVYSYKNDSILSIFYQNLSLIMTVSFVVLAVAFFLAELIIRRKVKGAVHTLPIVAFLLSITIIYSVYLTSEHFGTYNKLPSQEKIESVSFDYNDARQLFSYSAIANDYDGIYDVNSYSYESKNADDIKLAAELFEAARNEKYDENSSDYDGRMDFVFKLKDGTVIKRSFDIHTKSVAIDINRKSYESNYYKGILKALLIDEYKISEDYDPNLEYYVYDNSFVHGVYKSSNWYCVGPSLMYEGYDRFETEMTIPPIEDTDGLCKALYEDLIKLPYDKAYNNTERPLGALMIYTDFVFYTDDYMMSNWGNLDLEETCKYWNSENSKKPETKHTAGKMTSGIYLYPEMKNTLKFLKDNGIEFASFEAKVKEVYFANEKISLKEANLINCKKLLETDKNFSQYKYYFDRNTIDGDYSYYETGSGLAGLYSVYYAYINNAADNYSNYRENVMTLFFDTFKKAGIELNKVTNAEKAQKIVSKSVPFFKNISSDDGRYIYIVYDNGVITEQYLPAANIGVIK